MCWAADVLIVQLNILLKCQVACGDCQRDKTDTDRRRNPSLTFIIHIFPLKSSVHLYLISWPGKGHTCPRGQEAHRLGVGLHSYTTLTFIWIVVEVHFHSDCFFFASWRHRESRMSCRSALWRALPALQSSRLCLRHARWGECGDFFSRLRDVINAEGFLLIQRLHWSFWTSQLQINGSYILSQSPNWHSNTCDIFTPQLFHPNCFSSHPLPFLFFYSLSSSSHFGSAIVSLGTLHLLSHLSLTILTFQSDSFNISQ